MKAAKAAHIDAFALNMGRADPTSTNSVPAAFEAANKYGFQLFFSFDYAGNGPWAIDDVIDYLDAYGSNAAYYKYNGKPLVSTFEGPESASDWTTIKSKTGCFFIPDYSSYGPQKALALGVADGLFNWGAWPSGPTGSNIAVDDAYLQALNQSGTPMPYMMPASPWFYTNLPNYNKNWVWRGDDLWYDRWQEIFSSKPEFVEIITWNDYGESH
jgi:hypothetical protein